MNKIKKIFFSFLFVLIFVLSGISYADEYYYATTDMTFAEFYAGETGQTSAALLEAGLDAISSPTKGHTSRFPLMITSENEAGSTFSGVKGVQVRMSEEIYTALSNDVNARTRQNGLSRYTFTNETFTEYKEVTAKDTFGAMVEEETTTYTSEDAAVTLRTGANSAWGNYMLVVSGIPIETGENISSRGSYSDANNLLGGTVTTSDGTVYGLRVDNNLWSSSSDIAFTVDDSYVEIHGQGVKRDYTYTADLPGKVITEIKYMLKDKPDVIISGLNISIDRLQTVKAVTPEGGLVANGGDLEVTMSFNNLPDDVTFSEVVSVQRGGGRGAVTLSADTHYSYDSADKILTLKNAEAGFHRITFKASDESYSNITAGFYVTDAHYAVTDMTWAEFYAGELNNTAAALEEAGLDAYTSATAKNFPVVAHEENSITGLKDVKVKISDAVYQTLTDKSRYTFINATDTAFKEYKEVTSENTFGAMTTASTDISDAEVAIASGANSAWGSYLLTISSADLSSITSSNYLGAIIETDNGSYGMRHINNLWYSASNLGLTVDDAYVEIHGTHVERDYDYTADIVGKTINKITYLIKDLPDIIISGLNIKIEQVPTVRATGTLSVKENLEVTMSFDNVPDDVNYNEIISVQEGGGRGAVTLSADSDYSYDSADKILTLTSPKATFYRVVFKSSNTDTAPNIRAGFYLTEAASSDDSGGKEQEPTDGGKGTVDDESKTDDTKSTSRSTPLATPIKGKSETPSSTAQASVKNSQVISAVETAIENATGSSIPDSAKGEIKILSDNAKGGYKNLTASQILPFVTASEDNPVELETISVDVAGIYLFKVPEDVLTAGLKIFIHMLVPDNFSLGSFKVAEKETNSAVFMNDSGEIINAVPENKDVNIAAYLQAGTEYTPVLTEVAESSSSSGNLGGSGGGCNSINIFSSALLLSAASIIRRKK